MLHVNSLILLYHIIIFNIGQILTVSAFRFMLLCLHEYKSENKGNGIKDRRRDQRCRARKSSRAECVSALERVLFHDRLSQRNETLFHHRSYLSQILNWELKGAISLALNEHTGERTLLSIPTEYLKCFCRILRNGNGTKTRRRLCKALVPDLNFLSPNL